MPAKSKAQQRFMGMVHSYKKGETKGASPSVKKAAKGMSKKSAKDFASTKHKGKPERVKEAMDFSKYKTSKLVKVYNQMKDERLSGSAALTFKLMHKELKKRVGSASPSRKMRILKALREQIRQEIRNTLNEASNFRDKTDAYTNAMTSLDRYFLNIAAIPAPKKAKKVSKLINTLRKTYFSKDESSRTKSIDGENLLKFLMKRFKYSRKQAIDTMKKHKMDLSFLKKEGASDFSSSVIKKATDIAKKMGGNMTGAVKKIEKIKKGLSSDPKVYAALRYANESVNEKVAHPFSQHLRTAQEEVEWMLSRGPTPDGDDSVYGNPKQSIKFLQVAQKALGKIT